MHEKQNQWLIHMFFFFSSTAFLVGLLHVCCLILLENFRKDVNISRSMFRNFLLRKNFEKIYINDSHLLTWLVMIYACFIFANWVYLIDFILFYFVYFSYTKKIWKKFSGKSLWIWRTICVFNRKWCTNNGYMSKWLSLYGNFFQCSG